jgi:hypothetical protein
MCDESKYFIHFKDRGYVMDKHRHGGSLPYGGSKS